MSNYPRSEIEAHFARWREAVNRHDLEAMAPMLAEDARGGNEVFGLFEGRNAIMQFMKHWPDSVPNRSVWCVIDGSRVVNKWRETLPGTPPEGSADAPRGGEGVLIELVQAPPEVIAAHR